MLHIAGFFPFFGYPYWSSFRNVITICWISTWNFISFSRGSTIFIGSLIERSSTLSLTETGFGFIVFSLLLLQSAMKSFIGFLFFDLALLGLGLSLVNFALRGHILATVKDKKSQATLFSLVTMTANLGSAIGPLASNYIYKSFGQTLFFYSHYWTLCFFCFTSSDCASSSCLYTQ